MKSSLSILIVFILSWNLNAQDLLSGIKFKEVSPSWSYIILDSISNNADKTSHLLSNQYLRVNDSILIMALFISNTELLEGTYMEAINIYKGKKVWDNYFDISTSGEKEFLQRMYINDSGNIEMICFREVLESITSIYGRSQLSLREYSVENGELLSHTFMPTPTGQDLLQFNFRNNAVKSNDEYIFIDDNSHPFTFEKSCKSFNDNAEVLDSFVITLNTKFGPYYIKEIYPYNENEFISCRYSTSQVPLDSLTSEAHDDNEFIVDFYDNSLSFVDSIFFSDSTPYNWNKSARSFDEDLFIIDSFDSINVLNKHYYALGVYNREGTEIVTFDFKNDWSNGKIDIRKIPHSENFIAVYPNEDINNIWSWNFLVGFSNNTTEKIAKFELEPDQNVYITSMEILEDRTVLISWEGSWTDSQGATKNANGIVAFPVNYFSTLSDYAINARNPEIKLFPNPASNICNIIIDSPQNQTITISMKNSMGQIVQLKKDQLHSGKNDIAIDLENLNPGVVFLTISNNYNFYQTRRFVKL